ncbi:MAG: Asp23/Gls24 family envelope stress response protein [Oscillospiraceae bacterium]|nr:Asp23/Gls24 family envelope stress response protein [Oscillospiraceae bacterium]
MADYKRYITQIQENGNVMISDDVVAAIAEHALAEVEGAAFHADVKKNWNKTMKILIAEDNSVSISVNITVTYGHSVVDVANNVQNVLTTAVENMTGVKVAEVNVNICGIVR